jgi:histidine ammonia-lyase
VIIVDSRRDFTLEHFHRVAVLGEGVRIGPRARRAMEAARASFMALLESDRTAFIYGTTTRPGVQVGRAVAPDEQRDWARSGLRHPGHGFGGGGELEERVVRGIVFARLANFVEGHAKVRSVIAERVAALLDGPLPRVPLGGQGGPGEVLTTSHAMSTVGGDFEEGEQMALLNGSPCAAALAADVALGARRRLQAAERMFALSIEAFQAPLEAYDEALEALWEDEHEIAALRALRGHLSGASVGDRLTHQAPVSYRILPRVLAQARRAVAAVEHAAAVSLRAVTDNPVYLPPSEGHPLGRVVSNGGYHNGAVYPAMSMLSAAWADLVLLAERQVTAMHVGATATHLPPLLERPGGAGGATNLFGWVAGSFVEDARLAATATLLPASPADAQNDVTSPTFAAYRKQRAAADALDAALALLAASASQALWATDREPAPPLRELLEQVRSVVAPVDDLAGRLLGEEVGQLAQEFGDAAVTGRIGDAAAEPAPAPRRDRTARAGNP